MSSRYPMKSGESRWVSELLRVLHLAQRQMDRREYPPAPPREPWETWRARQTTTNQ